MDGRKFKVDEDKLYPIFYNWLIRNSFNIQGEYVGNNIKYKNKQNGYENDVFSLNPDIEYNENNKSSFIYKPENIVIEYSNYPLNASYSNIKLDERKFIEILEICSKSMNLSYNKCEYFPYIKGENDKKLYIVNLYGDKLVITDNIDDATCFMDKEPIYELADKINMDLNVYIDEIVMREKYFRFYAAGFSMILKIYYHKNLNIDLEYIKENISGRYISMLADIEEIRDYEGTNIDAYIVIDNKGIVE